MFVLRADSMTGCGEGWNVMGNLKKMHMLRTVVIAGFAMSVIFHSILGTISGYGQYPYITFLFSPADRFNDFFNIYRATGDLNPYAAPVSVYLPFSFIPMYVLTFLLEWYALAVFSVLFLLFLGVLVYRNVPHDSPLDRFLSVIALVFMSYPVLFCLDRGNIEMLLFIFVALSVRYYRNGEDFKSVICLSLATAMKIYPAVFCMLYLADRKYRCAVMTVVLSVLLTLASGTVLEGGIIQSLQGFQHNLELFKRVYLSNLDSLHFSSSLYNFVALGSDAIPALQPVISGYRFIAAGLVASVAGYVMFVEEVFWKRVALLVFLILLAPAISYDYKLIHLFIPLLLFLQGAAASRFDLAYAGLFGLLLIPKDYLNLHGDVSISVILNPLLILTMMFLMVLDRQKEARA